MARKRQRLIHYSCISYEDGASFSAAPCRKPRAKKGQKNKPDPDNVEIEYLQKYNDYDQLPDSARRSVGEILANRINTRRAIRELVLPELEAIQKALSEIIRRLDHIEQSSAQHSS